MKLPIIEVRSASQVEAFIPFTALPRECSGKRYMLVEYVETLPQPDEGIPWALTSD